MKSPTRAALSLVLALSIVLLAFGCEEKKKKSDKKGADRESDEATKGTERKTPSPSPQSDTAERVRKPESTPEADPYVFIPTEKVSNDPDLRKMILRLKKRVKGKKVRRQWESLGKKKAVGIFLKAMRNPHPNIRFQAAQLIRRMGHKSKPFTSLLSRMLLRDPDPDVRGNIAEEMVYYLNPANVPALVVALGKDPSDGVRMKAAWALGSARDARGVDALIGVLKDESTHVRLRAVNALGRIRSKKAIPHLIGRLSDSNPLVRTRARNELARITGKKLGESKEAWRAAYPAAK